MHVSTFYQYFSLKYLGYFFYVVDPAEHSPENVSDVREYFHEAMPITVILVIVESLLDFMSKKPANLQDTVSNAGHVILLQLTKIPIRGSAMWTYNWVYANYRIVDLPCNSTAVWILGFFAADLNYYCVHRLTHQVHLFWAVHEVHHAPENLVLSATVRNHVFYFVTFWVIFNPFAFVIPPSINLVHYELGLVYQIWLHTEKIGKCPWFIEFVLNTPSHHRVHHARNRKYIDKNFGAVLIIWDRLFRTYEDEDPNDKPVFGTTVQTKSFNPLVTQTKPFHTIWNKMQSYENVGDKLSAVFKGPGWSPGKPWTGNLEDIPHPPTNFVKYYPQIPFWAQVYVFVHFLINMIIFVAVDFYSQYFSDLFNAWLIVFIFYSIITLGFMQDNSKYVEPLEFVRIVAFLALGTYWYINENRHLLAFAFVCVMQTVFVFSALLWVAVALENNGTKQEVLWSDTNPLAKLLPSASMTQAEKLEHKTD